MLEKPSVTRGQAIEKKSGHTRTAYLLFYRKYLLNVKWMEKNTWPFACTNGVICCD